MKNELTLDQANRRVALSLDGPVWQLHFVLATDQPEDREEIEDIVGEFDALLFDLNIPDVKFEAQTSLSAGPLPVLNPASWRIAFLRRES